MRGRYVVEVTVKSYRFVNVFLGVLLALAIGGSALGAETIVGEVIDQGCFLRQGARGADHQECAARCLRNGNPAGVLTDEGEVYTLATSAAAFEGFAAKRIRVAGKRVDRSIFPESMQVWENESWVDVPLHEIRIARKGVVRSRRASRSFSKA